MSEATSRKRRFRRPTLATALLAGSAFLVLLALGSWQVQRAIWKGELNAERRAHIAAPAEPLPEAAQDWAAWDYRRVDLKGRFLHAHELMLGARSLNGNVGYHLLTPLEEAGGRVVLIDRGWIPLDKKEPETRAEANPEGPVALEGVLRIPRKPGWFAPANAPEENFWIWVDVPAMEQATGLTLAPFFVEADARPNPGGWPKGGQTQVDLPNDHVQYAITWYALAAALAVIVVLYHRRKPAEGDG